MNKEGNKIGWTKESTVSGDLSNYATKTDLNKKVSKEEGKSLVDNELIEKLKKLEDEPTLGTIGTDEEVFDENGNYIPTVWDIGDKITAEKLNKMEEGLSTSVGSAKYSSDFIHDITEKRNTVDVKFDGVEVGKVYLGTSSTPSSLSSSFKTYYKSVSSGEVYTISTTTIAHKSYGAVQFYNDDGYVGVIEKNPEAVARTLTVTFTIPDNVTLIRSCVFDSIPRLSMSTTTHNTSSEFIENIYQSSFYYALNDDTMLVGYKAGTDKDIYVELKNKGGNNLFDFSYFYQADNNTNIVDTSRPNFRAIGSAGGDWHGPFVVKALNDIDGDNLKEDTTYNQYFTGGNHQYNNLGDGSTKTAKQSSLRFIVDGREITQGKGFARNIEIRWSNLIQGYNTTKSDGSGRAILQENHILKFDGDAWYTEVELVALEDLMIIRWYGLQAQIDIFANDFRYIGGTNRKIYVGDVNSDCGGNKAFTMIARGDEYCLRMELDVTYDIGAMETGYGTPYAFKHGEKCYFYPVVNLSINKDERYCLRGSYKIYAK